MKFTSTLSGRLLLLLGVAVPTVFLSTGVGATSLKTEASVEPTGFNSAVSFAPNLENKLKNMVQASSQFPESTFVRIFIPPKQT